MFLTTLPNNLRVLHLPFPSTSSVLITLKGKAGRRAESEKEIGAAHFLEHLYFDGTKKRPSALEVNKVIEDVGGQRNGNTGGSETVTYHVKILADKAEIGFEYLSDILLNSLLKEIEKERKIIFEEIAMYKDRPESLLNAELKSLIYPNQPMGRKFTDDDKNLDSLTRKILVDFQKKNYFAQNFILSIAGNISQEKATALANKYFSQFGEGKETNFPTAEIEKEMKLKIINQDLKQSKLLIGFKAYSRINFQERICGSLLRKLLTGSHSARIYQRLRDELHLIYFIRSYLAFYSDTGYLSLETETSESNLIKVINEVFKEIKSLLSEGINEEELQRAKNLLLSDFLFGLENLEEYAAYFNFQVLFKDKIVDVENFTKMVEKTSKEQVMSAAEYIFSDKPKICVLTPKLKELSLLL